MPPPSQPSDELAGLIERVTFFNEETGFAVLRVKAKGRRDLLTVIGKLPAVNAGEWIHASGQWVRDREHGLQLRAERIKSTPPTSREGMEKYLGSGMIKGIGPVYAKKLVHEFGEEIIEVIEKRSKLLEQIDGIGPMRRKKIRDAWDEQRVIRDIMVFLHSHSVSTSRAVRIYKTYGNEAIETVRSNPYVLCRDIRGIGFKTADQIAQKTGIPFDSLMRARAGIHHVLLEATGRGHCRLPRTLLLTQSEELLQIDPSIITTGLDQCLESIELLSKGTDDDSFIYLPPLLHAETTISDRFRSIAKTPPSYPTIDIPKAIEWVQDKIGIALASQQSEAIRTVLQHRAVIITGGPGVGKTTLIQSILRILKAKQVEYLLCAPTGRAAKRMTESTGSTAKTIHRLLEVDPRKGGFQRNESRPLETQVLIVDECSMVDVPLMQHLLRAIPPTGHLILVGDIDQLPSVGPGSVLRDMIESDVAPVVRLTEVFRQAAGSQIIANAHLVNQGILPAFNKDKTDSDFFLVNREEPEKIIQTLIHLVKDRIPQRFGLNALRDVQVLCPMNRGSLGTRSLNVDLQEALNPQRPEQASVERFGWQFRPRDKVIQTVNNYDKDVFNGDIGHVVNIDPTEQVVEIRFDERVVSYDYGELDELSLAYAITIHKSQGSEFPAVVIPVSTQQFVMLQRNLIYTGMTRGRKLVVMVGQPKAMAMAVKNIRYEERFSGLLENLRH
ncbi:ATP-dependent RecD-like DNA helicase [bacterium]|jgi:exodeoxyribonuclease V alpha subunit|nr:ATP-dependent RecD-like DNA helicase [bacterium]MDA7657101.1 ATP-dependent RecD-like DNA helicase [Verrucomicrobiota bacterium]